jgi:hypothetical protein
MKGMCLVVGVRLEDQKANHRHCGEQGDQNEAAEDLCDPPALCWLGFGNAKKADEGLREKFEQSHSVSNLA